MPLGLYSAGGEYTAAGYAEALAMVNERRTNAYWRYYSPGLHKYFYVPFSAIALTGASAGSNQTASIINQLRVGIEEVLGFYLDKNVHANGSIDGLTTTPTYWTKATLLTYLGIGGTDGYGVRNWTNIPDNADAWDIAQFGSSLKYGSTLFAGPTLYSTWLNEIIQVCRGLTHLVCQGGGPVDVQVRRTEGNVGTGAADGYSCAAAHHLSTSWGVSEYWGGENSCELLSSGVAPIPFGFMGYEGGAFIGNFNGYYESKATVLHSGRGKVAMPFERWAAGSAKVYLKLGFLGAPKHWVGGTFCTPGARFGQPNRPVSAPQDAWGYWKDASLGAAWTSPDYVEGTDVLPSEHDSWGDTEWAVCWTVDDYLAVVEPTFQYT